MSEVWLPILVILVLIVVNGVFVAAEFALVGARRSRLATLAQGGSRPAGWLLGVFDRPAGKDAYIAIAQLGITLASIGLGMYGEPAVASWLYPGLHGLGLSDAQVHLVAFVIALSAITYLHVVLGEMIPKALALQAPEQVSIATSPLMRLFGIVFRPMVFVLNRTAFALMRMLGIPEPGKGASLYTSKELEIATGELAQSGQLDLGQRALLDNIFEMEDRIAEELMTSRGRMQAIAADADFGAVALLVGNGNANRYPVFEESLDNVLGVLHVKDFIRARARGEDASLRGLLRPLPNVAATTSAEELLALFKRQRVHAALVVDEFGGTLGFVTMDDLVADVIDEEAATPSDWIRRDEDGSLALDGEVTLAELGEDYGIDLEHPEVMTVAGLFLAARGTLPGVGDAIECKGRRLVVEELKGLKITRVRLLPVA
ncbi:hemolysin family protein [Luteimonas terricola]|uniref:Hemolysin n=1 Tax=Luteimonas terricola TaxID=645597 RepID=A0ABQ2E8I8_9GAMM|nr:hemolysin family protein [Luteimonas terricola]GGJ97237.1 hemolysin [Luteimonas terricola]